MTMSLKPSLTFITLLALLGLSGCDLIGGGDESADSRLSKEAIATRDAAPEDVFKGVLAPDFYPMWTACQRQSMSFEKGALTVTLGRMAFGAGGCCATGGTYRSTDGRNWKKIAD